jgi:hypothetical protein
MYVNYISPRHLWRYALDAGGEYRGPTIGWVQGLNKLTYDFLFAATWNAMEKYRTGIVMMDYPGPELIYFIICHNPKIPSSADDPDLASLPTSYDLAQNYPNPFNPSTTIEYDLPALSHVTVEILNVLGQRVRMLVDREEPAGSYTVMWDGNDDRGQPVSTGVYFYRIETDGYLASRKMLLLK